LLAGTLPLDALSSGDTRVQKPTNERRERVESQTAGCGSHTARGVAPLASMLICFEA